RLTTLFDIIPRSGEVLLRQPVIARQGRGRSRYYQTNQCDARGLDPPPTSRPSASQLADQSRQRLRRRHRATNDDQQAETHREEKEPRPELVPEREHESPGQRRG